ncbi:MAG: ABC transporter permease [Lysinibacillus sp.]
MNISISRIQAIFIKDYKEFSRNYAVSIMMLVPLLLAFVYNKMGANGIHVYILLINMSFTLVTAYIQCCLIAEEKEKNTLRSLMLSPASLADILIGKSSFVFAVSTVVVSLAIYLIGYKPANLLFLGVALLLSILFYIALGTLCGLFTKTIMEASLATLPILVIFAFGPSALSLSDAYPILKIAEWIPSAQLLLLAEALEGKYSTMDVLVPIATITAWTLIAWAFTIILYKKRMVD